jgi:hypothetical protein
MSRSATLESASSAIFRDTFQPRSSPVAPAAAENVLEEGIGHFHGHERTLQASRETRRAGGGRRLRECLGVGLGGFFRLACAWLLPKLPSHARSGQLRARAGGTWQTLRAKHGGGGGPRLREGLGAGPGRARHTESSKIPTPLSPEPL